MAFRNEFSTLLEEMDGVQRQTVRRLAEIEAEDADICANWGGEDCICCEIYQDRNKWVSPWELFNERW